MLGQDLNIPKRKKSRCADESAWADFYCNGVFGRSDAEAPHCGSSSRNRMNSSLAIEIADALDAATTMKDQGLIPTRSKDHDSDESGRMTSKALSRSPNSARIAIPCRKMLRSVDLALYRAKSQGRNRVELSDCAPESEVEPQHKSR
jgi:hypothetical protein